MPHNSKLFYKDIESPVGSIRFVSTINGLAAILWEGEGYKRTKLSTPERGDHAPVLVRSGNWWSI
jgi:methylated-DNA-[protein]-cysteine S-methyltransferase